MSDRFDSDVRNVRETGAIIGDSPPDGERRLRSRHLLSISDLSVDEILLILDTAEAMKEVGGRAIKKVPTLRGRTVANHFFGQR